MNPPNDAPVQPQQLIEMWHESNRQLFALDQELEAAQKEIPQMETTMNEARLGVEAEFDANAQDQITRAEVELNLMNAIDDYLDVATKGELRSFLSDEFGI